MDIQRLLAEEHITLIGMSGSNNGAGILRHSESVDGNVNELALYLRSSLQRESASRNQA